MGAARNEGDQMQAFSDPNRMLETHALPDIEYWYQDKPTLAVDSPGWFWWPCFPGCLPDSDEPNGPFGSEKACVDDFTQDWEDD